MGEDSVVEYRNPGVAVAVGDPLTEVLRSLLAKITRERIITAALACISIGALFLFWYVGTKYRLEFYIRFKNVPTPVEVCAVSSASACDGMVFDPVCRMHVELATAPARLPYGMSTQYFCSLGCARAFAASPEQYATP